MRVSVFPKVQSICIENSWWRERGLRIFVVIFIGDVVFTNEP